MARSLKLRDQFRVRLLRLFVLRFSGAQSFHQVGVNLFLVAQVKRKSAVHLLERQRRIALDHALCRHSLAEEVDQGIEGYARLPDPTYSFGIQPIVTRLHLAGQHSDLA